MTTINQQKKFCIKYINSIDHDKQIKVLQLFVLKIDNALISEHADGTRILIDSIDDSIISEIYNLIKNNL